MPSLNGYRGSPIERAHLIGEVAGEFVWRCRVCESRLTRNAHAICAHCASRGRTWRDDGKGLEMDMAAGVFGGAI